MDFFSIAWARAQARQLEKGNDLSLDDWGRFLLACFPDEYADPPPPARPTDVFPRRRTDAEEAAGIFPPKVHVLAARYAAGEGLWHPLDIRIEDHDRLGWLARVDPNGTVTCLGWVVLGDAQTQEATK